MTYERAVYHAQRLGAEFQQDMWNKRVSCRELAARYDLDHTTAWDIRRVLVPLPHRNARIVVTDDLTAIFGGPGDRLARIGQFIHPQGVRR